MESRIALLPRYIKTFGLFKGVRTFLSIEILKRTNVSIPGLAYPVHLREHTSDVKVFHEVFLFQSYLLDIDAPATILDGGANIGLGSLYFASLYHNALIIAVEPDEGKFSMLKKNTANYPNIRVVKTALWPTSSFLKIQDAKSSEWAFQVVETNANDSGVFSGTSIAQIMSEFGLSKLDLLKLDIEGSEYDLFKSGYETWIDKVQHIVVEVHDWARPGASRSVFGTIARYPFVTSVLNGMLMFTRTA
jgi:FkbM family methyltransferase